MSLGNFCFSSAFQMWELQPQDWDVASTGRPGQWGPSAAAWRCGGASPVPVQLAVRCWSLRCADSGGRPSRGPEALRKVSWQRRDLECQAEKTEEEQNST